MTQPTTTCAQCGQAIKGRLDKKFCDDTCRNAYHNTQNKESVLVVRQINTILKQNRKILESLNITGKTKVHKDMLLKKGFDFKYHTHSFTTKTGAHYSFCYEHGFMVLDADFFMLVIDQRNAAAAANINP